MSRPQEATNWTPGFPRRQDLTRTRFLALEAAPQADPQGAPAADLEELSAGRQRALEVTRRMRAARLAQGLVEATLAETATDRQAQLTYEERRVRETNPQHIVYLHSD